MTVTAAVLNMVLGLIYVGYGVITLIDMRRHQAELGFSRFGAAWVLMAFTCGPHHLHHGVHLLGGQQGTGMDVAAVAVGFPAGAIWIWLRLEAFAGGPGDRLLRGTPMALALLPTLGGLYAGVLLAQLPRAVFSSNADVVDAIPNLLLVGVYAAVGAYIIRTQLANHRSLRGWSLSGLALGVVFPTCAAMHGAHALAVLEGSLDYGAHGTLVDWLAVPAGLFFLAVVRSLSRGTWQDWNRARRVTPVPQPEPARAIAG
ncbi:MAG TPA: hypothetical protein VD931_18510 [Baekduia sp.]|nr:hypothetical protein [Baekduia sp.]